MPVATNHHYAARRSGPAGGIRTLRRSKYSARSFVLTVVVLSILACISIWSRQKNDRFGHNAPTTLYKRQLSALGTSDEEVSCLPCLVTLNSPVTDIVCIVPTRTQSTQSGPMRLHSRPLSRRGTWLSRIPEPLLLRPCQSKTRRLHYPSPPTRRTIQYHWHSRKRLLLHQFEHHR